VPKTALPPAEILLVDDDAPAVRLLHALLRDLGRIRVANRPDQALLLALELPPDMILLDAEMPGMSGFEVCEALKAEPGLADVPVIFVTAHAEAAFEVAGFQVGAADFIAKPVHADLLRARVTAQLRVKRMADELRRLSRRDGLTELANAEAFAESLEGEWRRAQREGQALALLRAEVDDQASFKARYGEPAFDLALRRIAAELRRVCARPADRIARWSATGFALLLPGTGRDGAQHLGHHLLEAVERLAIAHAEAAMGGHLTISLGLTVCDAATPGWKAGGGSPWKPVQLLHGAEAALHAAQAAGGAQGWWLDIADHDQPGQAREFDARLRPPRPR